MSEKGSVTMVLPFFVYYKGKNSQATFKIYTL